jgi:hypothetical protein
MHMLGHVLLQLRQKVGTWMDLCLAKVSQLILLCNSIIVDGITQLILIAQYIKSKLVALKLSIKPYLAQFTNQVLLIKVGLMIVLHKLGELGQQLLTTARQILQRAWKLAKREQ